jgi:group I intron endonuclease
MKTGIYTITNLVNNKMYLGFAVNIAQRWAVHKNDLRKNKHQNIYLQRAWLHYREESFVFEVLEECGKDLLCSQEHYWCNMLDLKNPLLGYNLKETSPDCRCKNSEETKTKMSISRKSWLKNNPEYNSFKNMSEESILKKNKNRGKKVIQYDLNGNIVKKYNSLIEAKEFGFLSSCIQACCVKKIKIYKGLVFRYEKDPFSIEKFKIKSKHLEKLLNY